MIKPVTNPSAREMQRKLLYEEFNPQELDIFSMLIKQKNKPSIDSASVSVQTTAAVPSSVTVQPSVRYPPYTMDMIRRQSLANSHIPRIGRPLLVRKRSLADCIPMPGKNQGRRTMNIGVNIQRNNRRRNRKRRRSVDNDDDDDGHDRKRSRKTEENTNMDREKSKSNSASIISIIISNEHQSSALKVSQEINLEVVDMDIIEEQMVNHDKSDKSESVSEVEEIIEITEKADKPSVTFADDIKKEEVIIDDLTDDEQTENNEIEIKTKVDNQIAAVNNYSLKPGYYAQVLRERDNRQRVEYKMRLKRIYTKHNISKVENISDVVVKYKNNIHNLYEKICAKYNLIPYSEYDGQEIATPTEMEKEIPMVEEIDDNVNENDVKTNDKSNMAQFKFNINASSSSLVSEQSQFSFQAMPEVKKSKTNDKSNVEQFRFTMPEVKKSKTQPITSNIPMDFNFAQQTNDESNAMKNSNGKQTGFTRMLFICYMLYIHMYVCVQLHLVLNLVEIIINQLLMKIIINQLLMKIIINGKNGIFHQTKM